VAGFYTYRRYAQPLFGELLSGINFGWSKLAGRLQNLALLKIFGWR
jgi:hypothetical protein